MNITNSFGEGSSPVLADGKLVILWQHDGDSFLAALDPADGKEVWRKERESGTSWCTPTCVETAAGTVVVVPGSTTTAYRAEDGEVLWSYAAPAPQVQEAGGGRGGRGGGGGGRSGVVTSAVADAGVVYLSTSSRGGAFLALEVEPKEAGPDGKSGPLLWSRAGDTPYIPSPILYDGILYSLKSNSAILSAMDAATGEVLYEGQRLDRLGDSYASPVAANGKLYFCSRDGTCEVVRAGKSAKPVGLTLLVNWAIKPFTMYAIAVLFLGTLFLGFIGPDEVDHVKLLRGELAVGDTYGSGRVVMHDGVKMLQVPLWRSYLAGCILLGIAPCTAMVLVWGYLARGNDALTLVIGSPPAVRLTWDDPGGRFDHSFSDFQSTPYDYERTVTATSFHVLASAYTTITEVTSSNNAEKARVYISASSGFLVTDSDYYGL